VTATTATTGGDGRADAAVGATPGGLTEAQLTSVALAVREMMTEGASGRGGGGAGAGHAVSALLARLRARGLRYGRPAVLAALAELERRHTDAPGAPGSVVPIMFDAAADAFYEA
jgi:hypothetical protein